jgi:hypothetical protein
MQGFGSAIGSALNEGNDSAWRELSDALQDFASRLSAEQSSLPKRGAALLREFAVDEAAEALWDRGTFY